MLLVAVVVSEVMTGTGDLLLAAVTAGLLLSEEIENERIEKVFEEVEEAEVERAVVLSPTVECAVATVVLSPTVERAVATVVLSPTVERAVATVVLSPTVECAVATVVLSPTVERAVATVVLSPITVSLSEEVCNQKQQN